MLKDWVRREILNQIEKQRKTGDLSIRLYREEKEYAERNRLVPEEFKESARFIELNSSSRFLEAHIERCEKESDQLVAIEDRSLLEQPVEFLKKHQKEYIYLESDWFDNIGVDAISLELDDVFKTYSVMLGLKLRKKAETALKAKLNHALSGEMPKFSILYNRDDELWDVNFPLNNLRGFRENMSIGEAYQMIYGFLFNLVEDLAETE